MFSFKRLRYLLFLPLLVILAGTIGFMFIQNLSFLDALYFTIMTVSTIGYGDITPAGTGGKIFAMFITVFGLGSFLTMLTTLAQWFIQRQQNSLHRQRLDMLVGVFFTEAGNKLLRILADYDPEIDSMRKSCFIETHWTDREFGQLRKMLQAHRHNIDPAKVDLDQLQAFLMDEGDLFMRQLENADLVDNETFTQLLWATVHLRDELAVRSQLDNLPESDRSHLVNDVKRVYGLLTRQWLEYMQHLKAKYPFLFSLAVRTNPFVENPSPVIKQ